MVSLKPWKNPDLAGQNLGKMLKTKLSGSFKGKRRITNVIGIEKPLRKLKTSVWGGSAGSNARVASSSAVGTRIRSSSSSNVPLSETAAPRTAGGSSYNPRMGLSSVPGISLPSRKIPIAHRIATKLATTSRKGTYIRRVVVSSGIFLVFLELRSRAAREENKKQAFQSRKEWLTKMEKGNQSNGDDNEAWVAGAIAGTTLVRVESASADATTNMHDGLAPLPSTRVTGTMPPKKKPPVIFVPGYKGCRLESTADTNILMKRLTRTAWGYMSCIYKGILWPNKNHQLASPIEWDANGVQKTDDYVPTGIMKYLRLFGFYTLHPGESVCQEFFDKLSDEEDFPYYEFLYDWRRSPVEIGAKLSQFIDNVTAENNGEKPRILAHSFGALMMIYVLSAKELYYVNFSSSITFSNSDGTTKGVPVDTRTAIPDLSYGYRKRSKGVTTTMLGINGMTDLPVSDENRKSKTTGLETVYNAPSEVYNPPSNRFDSVIVMAPPVRMTPFFIMDMLVGCPDYLITASTHFTWASVFSFFPDNLYNPNGRCMKVVRRPKEDFGLKIQGNATAHNASVGDANVDQSSGSVDQSCWAHPTISPVGPPPRHLRDNVSYLYEDVRTYNSFLCNTKSGYFDGGYMVHIRRWCHDCGWSLGFLGRGWISMLDSLDKSLASSARRSPKNGGEATVLKNAKGHLILENSQSGCTTYSHWNEKDGNTTNNKTEEICLNWVSADTWMNNIPNTRRFFADTPNLREHITYSCKNSELFWRRIAEGTYGKEQMREFEAIVGGMEKSATRECDEYVKNRVKTMREEDLPERIALVKGMGHGTGQNIVLVPVEGVDSDSLEAENMPSIVGNSTATTMSYFIDGSNENLFVRGDSRLPGNRIEPWDFSSNLRVYETQSAHTPMINNMKEVEKVMQDMRWI